MTPLTSRDYTRAYEQGEATPEVVLSHTLQLIQQLEHSAPSLEAFVALDEADVMTQARAASARYAKGAPLGALDGVPIAIKDEFDVEGYPTTAGTRFRGHTSAERDSEVVARLRAAGAIILGKVAMHEIGLGGTGINPTHLTARNPHDMTRWAGGSSSGSAAVVAASLCPLALGSDAGGSIRIPASCCGVYGLKPTYGRIPTTGGALLAWTLDHLGPLGASLDDLALFLGVTAGADAHDASSQLAPALSAHAPHTRPRPRLAWSRAWSEHASAEVRACFEATLTTLRAQGFSVEELPLPLADAIQRVGYITLISEAAASQRDWLREHRHAYNLETRLLLAVGERVTASEYLHAQRVRGLICAMFDEALGGFDALLSPTTGCVAQPLTAAALGAGEVNSPVNAAISQFTFAANLTGRPALTLPMGVDSAKLPIGLQLMGHAWQERGLLDAARALQPHLPRAPIALPHVHHSIANILSRSTS